MKSNTLPKALRFFVITALFLGFMGSAHADWSILYDADTDSDLVDMCASGCNTTDNSHLNNADGLWGKDASPLYFTIRDTPGTEMAWGHFLADIGAPQGEILADSLELEVKMWSSPAAAGENNGTIWFSSDNATWYWLDFNTSSNTWRNLVTDSNLTQPDIIDFINTSGFFNIYIRPNTTTSTAGLSFRGLNLTGDAAYYNISERMVTNCSNPYHQPAINFTFFNETNSAKVSSDLDLAVDILLDNGTVRSVGINYDNSNFHELCILPAEGSFTANLTAQFYNGDYEPREYYEVSRTLDNTTDDIELYQIHASDATLWEVETVNEAGSPLENIYIEVERFFPETNSYTELCRMRTDNNGEDSTYTLWYDAFYRFNFTDGFGESYLLTTPSKITDSPVTYTLSTLGEIAIFEYVNEVDAEVSQFDNGNLTITTTDSSNYMTSTCYVVTEKTNMSYDTEINDTCIVGSPTTFETNINTSLHHLVTVRMLYGTESFLVYSDVIGPDATVPFGDTGLLFGLILSMTFGMAGIAMGPTGAMLGWLAGYGISLGTGFIEVDDLVAHFMGIASFIIIIIYFINKRREFG